MIVDRLVHHSFRRFPTSEPILFLLLLNDSIRFFYESLGFFVDGPGIAASEDSWTRECSFASPTREICKFDRFSPIPDNPSWCESSPSHVWSS